MYHSNGLYLYYLSLCTFHLPDVGFSQEPKHAASNKLIECSCYWPSCTSFLMFIYYNRVSCIKIFSSEI